MKLTRQFDSKRHRQRKGALIALVSGGFVLLGVALGEDIPWYPTAFFALCLVGGVISIFVEPPRGLSPAGRLVIDDVGITRVARKSREHVAWANITRVRILTTDQGPWFEDVFFVIDGADGTGCVVAHDLAVEGGLLEALQSRLEGIDNAAVIDAMVSAENREFTIWEAQRGA